MAAKKVYDLVVVTGSFPTQNGQKNRYKNVGSVIRNDDGSEFVALDRSFNPAGIPFKDGSDTITLSMFEPKENNQQGGGQQAPRNNGGGQQQQNRQQSNNRNPF